MAIVFTPFHQFTNLLGQKLGYLVLCTENHRHFHLTNGLIRFGFVPSLYRNKDWFGLVWSSPAGLEYGHRTSVWFRWVLVCFLQEFIFYSSGFLVSSLVLHSCIPVIVPVSYDPVFVLWEIWNIFNVFVTLVNFWERAGNNFSSSS